MRGAAQDTRELSPAAATYTVPTATPSSNPSVRPSMSPSVPPSTVPTATTSSSNPSARPSMAPSVTPSTAPTATTSSSNPSAPPSMAPSVTASSTPSFGPSIAPSTVPESSKPSGAASCDFGRECALYDLHTNQLIKTLHEDGNYDKRYKLPRSDRYHKGYSIKCNYEKYQVDYLKWSYPNGKQITSHYERSHPWWLNGDMNGVAAKADWLSKPGYKYVKLEAYKDNYVCYSITFQLDAYCPHSYYAWSGHCYKWSGY